MRNWINSTHERDYWRSLVITALNLQVPYAMGLVRLLVFRNHIRIILPLTTNLLLLSKLYLS